MFETSGDIMRMSFGIGFGVLVVFASMALLYLVFILRDVAKILDDVKDVSERVRVSVVSPLKVVGTIMEKVGPYIEQAVKAAGGKGKGKKK